MHRQRMTKAMRAMKGDRKSTPADRRLEHLGYRGRLQEPHRSTHPQKHMPIRGRWWSLLQVLEQSDRHLVRERQFEGRRSFALVNPETALPPVNVVKTQGDGFTSAQSIGRDHEEHCVVPQTHCGCRVN